MIPSIPKEGIFLPFFDDEKKVHVDDETGKIMNLLAKKINLHLGRVILKHDVKDVSKECVRKMIGSEGGWTEYYYIKGECVLVSKFILSNGEAHYLISEPQSKNTLFQA